MIVIYQLCSLDKNKDSISSSLSFIVKKGMKLTIKGGNKGTVSLVGFIEKFTTDEIEEINTDQKKEDKNEEVIPQIVKDKNNNKKKEEKNK